MSKKIVSIVLVLLLLFTMTAVVASAEQVELDEQGAEAVATVGADASDASTGANVIKFDANSAGWKNFKTVYAHIWACDGTGDWPSWQSKKEKCDYDESTGIASYDVSKAGEVGSGANWAVIFSNENGMQTFNLLFGSECFGDTAKCDGTEYENPTDSTKKAQAAVWSNQDKTKFGPCLTITSIGNVVGTCCPGNTSRYKLMVDFLKNNLENARTYSGKDDQTLLDDTGKALGLYKGDVEKAVSESGVSVEWSASASNLPDGENPEATEVPGGGEGGGSSSGSGSGSGSDSGSSSTGSGSSSKASTSATGQDTTMLIIMFAAIAVALAVIIITKRRSKASK